MPSHSKSFPVPGYNSSQIYEEVAKQIDSFLSKTPLGEYKVERLAQKQTVTFKASMASGSLIAKDGQLHVDLSLSLLATPFKSKIDEGIEKWLKRSFTKTT